MTPTIPELAARLRNRLPVLLRLHDTYRRCGTLSESDDIAAALVAGLALDLPTLLDALERDPFRPVTEEELQASLERGAREAEAESDHPPDGGKVVNCPDCNGWAENRYGNPCDTCDATGEVETPYPDLRPWDLEPYYCRHVSAMTTEGLHSKADIAKQLAWRDKRIAELESLTTWRPVTQVPTAEENAWCKGEYLLRDRKGMRQVLIVRGPVPEWELRSCNYSHADGYMLIPPSDESEGE